MKIQIDINQMPFHFIHFNNIHTHTTLYGRFNFLLLHFHFQFALYELLFSFNNKNQFIV